MKPEDHLLGFFFFFKLFHAHVWDKTLIKEESKKVLILAIVNGTWNKDVVNLPIIRGRESQNQTLDLRLNFEAFNVLEHGKQSTQVQQGHENESNENFHSERKSYIDLTRFGHFLQ